MKNVKELLDKLDRFEVVANEKNSKKTIHLENGLEVNYRVDTCASVRFGGIVFEPEDLFQVVIWVGCNTNWVKKGSVCGKTWGCIDMDENRAVVEWFIKKEAVAYKMESDERKKAEQDIKRLLS